jgi:fumarate reductase subunit C
MVQVTADALGNKVTPNEAERAPSYTEFHPRWYRRRVSTYWWLWKWSYAKFVLREISSVFVAWFVVTTLVQISCLSAGGEAYAKWQEWMRNPLLIALNAVSFFFVAVHTITWFNLAPRAMVLRVGPRRVPALLIVAANYSAWAVVSAVVAWIILGG